MSPDPDVEPAKRGGPDHLAVLEASPNAIVAIGADGLIAYANPQVEATFGWTPDELIGKPVELLIPKRVHERHIGHRTAFMERPHARPMGIGLDLAGRRRDGSEFPVEISLAPVRTPEGLQVFASVVDITARKEADEALAESERRFRAVVEASPDPIVAIDPEGLIVYAAGGLKATFGWSAEELIGLPIETLIPERFHERHVGHRTAFMRQPHARPMGIGLDLSGRRKDGSEFPVEISLSPVTEGDRPSVFARVVDITGRKALEGQLLQAQKMESLGRLAGGIAHDFNNMLSAIRGYAELLLDDLNAGTPPKTAEIQSSVEAIQAAADRAADLTAQLLAFTRRQVVRLQVIDLRASIIALEPMLKRLIGEHVALKMSLDGEAGNFRGDPGQLDQILVNLVVNARDAVQEGGTVTIEIGNVEFDEPYALEHFEVVPGPYVMLAVTDNGVGMDKATREHIFEPFFTTKERGQGTGLGLATIYGIVRQAQGHIWLYSEPGAGTTFKLYFPRVESLTEQAAPVTSAPSHVGSGRVLVVEDEGMVRDLTTRVLDRAGYDVMVARNAAEALDLVNASRGDIDALVTDVVMPGMSGPDLAEQMMDRFPSIAVVLVSGYTAETLHLESVLARGATFVAKPFNPQELVRAVATAIQVAKALPDPATECEPGEVR